MSHRRCPALILCCGDLQGPSLKKYSCNSRRRSYNVTTANLRSNSIHVLTGSLRRNSNQRLCRGLLNRQDRQGRLWIPLICSSIHVLTSSLRRNSNQGSARVSSTAEIRQALDPADLQLERPEMLTAGGPLVVYQALKEVLSQLPFSYTQVQEDADTAAVECSD